jgi:quinol-cytochrome oxidoreductase complex cytochrome b subunit
METIKKIILWFVSPFDNHSTGMSMRKVGAAFAIGVAAKLSFLYTTSAILSTVISIWLIYSALCLTLITGAQLLELRNGAADKKKEDTPENIENPEL